MIVSLYLFLEALIVVFLLHYLYGKKIKIDIITIAFVLVDVLWMQMIYYYNWHQSLSFMIYVIVACYSIIKFGMDIKALVVNNVLYLLMLFVLQIIALAPLSVFVGIREVDVYVSLIINIIIFLLVVFVLKHIKLHKLSLYLQDKERIMTIALVTLMICLVIFLGRYKSVQGFDFWLYATMVICVILLCVVVSRVGKYKYMMKEKDMELKTYKLYEKTFEGLVENIRARQHEFDNHINAVYSQHFLYNTYEELVAVQEQYCNDVVKENRYNKLLLAGNSMLVGFLYGKFLEAEKYNIEIEYSVNIKGLEIEIPVYKLIEVIGNLINNAMEQLKGNDTNRKLMVKITETDEVLDIVVGNESGIIDYHEIETFFKKGFSKKGEGRGYGLHNVKKVCADYGMSIECINDVIDEKNYLLFKIHKEKPLI